MNRRLFVYGTLRRGNSRFDLLGPHATLVGPARMQGRLYGLGDYPGLVPCDDPGAWVRGEVYALEDAGERLPRLDAYEGCAAEDPVPHEFERVECEVVLDGETTATAWVYVYRGPVSGHKQIASGDDLERSTEPEPP